MTPRIVLEITPGKPDPRVLVDGQDVTQRCRRIVLMPMGNASVELLPRALVDELFRRVGRQTGLMMLPKVPTIEMIEGTVGYVLKKLEKDP
jgi:hypothetical protein